MKSRMKLDMQAARWSLHNAENCALSRLTCFTHFAMLAHFAALLCAQTIVGAAPWSIR